MYLEITFVFFVKQGDTNKKPPTNASNKDSNNMLNQQRYTISILKILSSLLGKSFRIFEYRVIELFYELNQGDKGEVFHELNSIEHR